MKIILVSLIICTVVLMLLFNIYFKIKLTKLHRELTKLGIDFTVNHLLYRRRMEQEIFSRYPQHKNLISEFAGHARKSALIVFTILIFIILLGLSLILST